MKCTRHLYCILGVIVTVIFGVVSCLPDASPTGEEIRSITATSTITLQPPPVSTEKEDTLPPTSSLASATETPAIIRTATPTIDTVQTYSPMPEGLIDEDYQVAFAGVMNLIDPPGIYTSILQYPVSADRALDTSDDYRAIYSSPSWSPDGQFLTFARNVGTGTRIYIIRNDGSDFLRLSFQSHPNAYSPKWSPDGERIAYSSSVDEYIVLTRPDGTDERLIRVTPLPSSLTWSPDSKRLALITTDDSEGKEAWISILDIETGVLDALTGPITDTLGHLSWSPDGKHIVFSEVMSDGCRDLSIINIETRIITQLPATPFMDFNPVWSSDGSFILFNSGRIDDCSKYALHRGGSQQLYVLSLPGMTIYGPISPEGVNQPAIWPTTRIHTGWSYRVTELGDKLNLREQAGTSATRLAQLDKGDIVLVLDGPQEVEAYQWWLVQTSDGLTGWIAEVPGWFVLESANP